MLTKLVRTIQAAILTAEHLASAAQAPFDRAASRWAARLDPEPLEFELTGEVGPDTDGEFCPGWPAGETATAYISREIAR